MMGMGGNRYRLERQGCGRQELTCSSGVGGIWKGELLHF